MLRIPLRQPDKSIESYNPLLSPQSCHVRLAAACNLQCSFCERESWRSGDKAPEKDCLPDVWEAVKEKYMPWMLGIELCGLGEPTLARLFPKAASDVVAAGKVLYFPTNGYYLATKPVLDSVGDTPRVSISLDAWNAESYKRVRGGDWNLVMASIKAFTKEKPNAVLHSQFTAGTYNIDGLPQFVQVCADLGIKDVLMRFVQAHTVAREDVSLRFARDRTETAIEAARAIAEREKIMFTAERRPYSIVQPNSSQDQSPMQRLARYLDFVPLLGAGFGGSGYISSTNCLATQLITSVITIHGFFEPEGPGAKVLRRLAPTPPVIPAQRTIEYSPAALVVAWNGDLWSCFAGHIIGNALTTSMEDVILNSRYQTFLQNRQAESTIAQETWCQHCARCY